MKKKQAAQISARNCTREDAEAAMRALCIASCKIDAKTAKMNEALARVREDYETDISALSETADLLEARIAAWADRHPDEFLSRKTVEMVHGLCGYRTCPPAIRLVRGVTWDKAIALLEASRPEFVRLKKEADKEALIAAREVLSDDDYKALGLRLEQAEKFFVEVKKDSVPQE